MQFQLCKICLSRHGGNPAASAAAAGQECHICKNLFLGLYSLADSAISLAASNKLQWETFAITSTIPRPVLVREEDLFDYSLSDGLSAKNQLNRLAARHIEKSTGKKYSQKGADVTFALDLWHQKASALPSSIFIFTRYRKLSRGYCQHLWVCGNCRGRGCKKCEGKGENYPSVEGAIKSAFGPIFGASDVHLHASGREDVDVIMEGNGRPCVIEIVHPTKRNADLAAAAAALSSAHPIELGLPIACPPNFVEAVCTSHFEKKYRVWVDAGREVKQSELDAIVSSAPITLHQRTPVRVAQRRADLVRKRRVLEISCVEHSGSNFTLDLRTDAGTYIKEFVHGDAGRTVPSLSSLLSTNAQCKQLNVMHIYDDFVSTLR